MLHVVIRRHLYECKGDHMSLGQTMNRCQEPGRLDTRELVAREGDVLFQNLCQHAVSMKDRTGAAVSLSSRWASKSGSSTRAHRKVVCGLQDAST